MFLLAACASTPTPVPTFKPTIAPIFTATLPRPSATVTTVLPTLPISPTSTRRPSVAPSLPAPTIASSGWAVRQLLVGPGQPGRLYALLADRNAMFFSSPNARIVTSDDLGATWKPFAGNLPVEPTCLAGINLDYATQDAVYTSTCRGLYRWNANQWTLVSAQPMLRVAIAYGKPNLLYAMVTPQDGLVLRSDDAGKTWRNVANGIVHFSGLVNLALEPRENRALYGIISPKYGGSYLRRALNDNQWTTLPTPLNNSQIETGMAIDGATGALYVTAFTGQGWQLWRSPNPTIENVNAVLWDKVSDFPGEHWVTVLASGASSQGLALFVQVSPTNCNAADAACDSYILRSLDSGKTWTRLTIR